MPDGTVFEDTVTVPFFHAYPNAHKFAAGHWPLFYDAARRCLTSMLAMNHVHQNIKDGIYLALIEDRKKQNSRPQGSQSLLQMRVDQVK